MQLIIGDKNWSTWSMRPWLVLQRCEFPFEERYVRLRQDDTQAQIAPLSPSGKIPALVDGDLLVWDSLAICEYLADKFPDRQLWPADLTARARARSAVAEMHSGFVHMRKECPMDLKLRTTMELSEGVTKEVGRLVAIWGDLRRRYGADGPFLTGGWSIADAFFTPMATRLRTYGVDLADYGDDDGTAAAYVETMLSTPEFLTWERDALAE